MEDSTSTGGKALGSGSSKSLDLGRKYGKQDPTNRNNFFCNFCGMRTTRGVFRLKQHLVGGRFQLIDEDEDEDENEDDEYTEEEKEELGDDDIGGFDDVDPEHVLLDDDDDI